MDSHRSPLVLSHQIWGIEMEKSTKDQLKSVQPGGDPIGDLLSLAGPPPEIDMHCQARVKLAVHDAWRKQIMARKRTKRIRMASMIIAATLVLAAIVMYRPQQFALNKANAIAATVDRLIGPLNGIHQGERETFFVGTGVPYGYWVETGETSRAAFKLTDGASMRLDHESKFRFVNGEVIELVKGTLYIDSENQSNAVLVRTPWGDVQEIGTQYEVHLDGEQLRIRVREGEVLLTRESMTQEAIAGDELVLTQGQSLILRSVPVFGDAWDWTLSVAPVPDFDGKTLAQFFQWYARETGQLIIYDDKKMENQATQVSISGSGVTFTPEQALEAVLQTSNLKQERNGQRLNIKRTTPLIIN